MIKQQFAHFLIHIERFSNVVGSIHSSWLFPSRNLLLFRLKSHLSHFRSLGLLNYIRIWHDNSGQGSSASWFLKYIIVRDLQTMQKFHFISQRWFAVEKDDGKVTNVRMKFLAWFSLRNRSNEFSRLPMIKNVKNFLIYYRRKLIIVYPMDIYGFPSSLDHHQIDLHVFNVVLAVWFSWFFPCFWISCIIKHWTKRKQTIQQIQLVYPWVLYMLVHNR